MGGEIADLAALARGDRPEDAREPLKSLAVHKQTLNSGQAPFLGAPWDPAGPPGGDAFASRSEGGVPAATRVHPGAIAPRTRRALPMSCASSIVVDGRKSHGRPVCGRVPVPTFSGNPCLSWHVRPGGLSI